MLQVFGTDIGNATGHFLQNTRKGCDICLCWLARIYVHSHACAVRSSNVTNLQETPLQETPAAHSQWL